MKLDRGYNGGWFVVFRNEDEAEQWYWLFGRILRRPMACFGQWCNSYHLFGSR